MKDYLLLLRGINVGGKGKVSMSELIRQLEALGCQDVVTYINSGNVLLSSPLGRQELQVKIEKMLAQIFKLDSITNKVLLLDEQQLKNVITEKPDGFGEQPALYYSDVIFLIDCPVTEAMAVFDPREGVDTIWPGSAVIYSQRLAELRTKSRLSKIMSSPIYKSMTIRTWNTTTKLLELLQARKDAPL